MKIVDLDISGCLSSSEYDPSPHRLDPQELPVSERRNFPTVYQCDSCNYNISISLNDFNNHTETIRTNLGSEDLDNFLKYLKTIDFEIHSLLDFYCPNCKQATMILFIAGPSGYWGEYFVKIQKVLIIKS
jgi:hypothetical protein